MTAYYCPERHSREAQRLIRSAAQPSVSDLSEVELMSALARKVRTGEFPAAEAQRVAAQFLNHLEGQLYMRRTVERRHFSLARDWLGRFTTPLRTLDALHLAVATAEGLRLVTTDQTLARSAEQLGIHVVTVA